MKWVLPESIKSYVPTFRVDFIEFIMNTFDDPLCGESGLARARGT